MAVYGLLAKAAGTVVTGLVGVTAYELARKALDKAPLHETAVSAAELGLRGTRKAEEAAESAQAQDRRRDGRSPRTYRRGGAHAGRRLDQCTSTTTDHLT